LKKICFVKDIPHADLKVTKKYEEICSKLERMGFSLQPVNLDS